jgi:signal transduction histidine kinase
MAAGHGQRLWPAFALLTAVVVLPTAGVFWFMNQAMQNEQLAMRQRIANLYRSQLQNAADRIQVSWRKRSELLADTVRKNPAPESFALLINAGYADSVLIYKNGRLAYPEISAFPGISGEPQTSRWLEARGLEFNKKDAKAAAEAYGRIVRQSTETRETALALTAEARCLNKAGKQSQAIEVLVRIMGEARYRNARDAQGRSIPLNAQLFALQLMKNLSHPLFPQVLTRMARQLNDYRDPSIASSQRRFLMGQMRSLWPDCPQFPTFAAEDLAAGFTKILPSQLGPGQMQPTGMRDIWAYSSPDRSYIALFSQARLLSFMESVISAQGPVSGIRMSAIPPGVKGSWFQSEKIGNAFPSWELALYLDGNDPFQSAAKRRTALYVWTGILMTLGILLLSILLATYLQRQMRLTRIKNDLIATVSRELKTPLSSIRLLVDTLRDGRWQDSQLVKEYLQMISKENARLSSIIEEFLTFSRMERNKVKLEREVVRADEIIQSALDAVGNRLYAAGCKFELDLSPALPPVIGDRDALVTVFVNLLDNALKYTGENKEIIIRGSARNGNACFEVQDNGIGFPRSAAKKIFDRFYQVDRSLSRSAGGCGLGLSIVRFIVSAHNGSIAARSEPGKGSTFTIQFPAAE